MVRSILSTFASKIAWSVLNTTTVQFPVYFRYVIGRRSWIRSCRSCRLRKACVFDGRGPAKYPDDIVWKQSDCVFGMAKFSVRRHSDPFYVLALKEAIVKISAQKQCPNEGRIVRSVLQEFDWSKAEIVKQLKFAVKDGLILQVTTSSSHGSTKGIPQTAYRILRKDGEDDVSSFFGDFFSSWSTTRAGYSRRKWCPQLLLDGF